MADVREIALIYKDTFFFITKFNITFEQEKIQT